MKRIIWGKTPVGAAVRLAAAAGLAGAALGAVSAGPAAAAGGVTVSVTANPSTSSTTYFGSPLAYTITVANNSGGAATGLTLTDTLNGVTSGPGQGLPGPVTQVSAGSCSYSSPTETCTDSNLAAGGVWTVTINVAVCTPNSQNANACTVPTVDYTLTDTATVTGTNGGGSFSSSGTTTVPVNVGVPAGFAQTTLATGLTKPVVLAFAPNGDIYIGEQGGTIVIYRNGAVLGTALGTIPNVYSGVEEGLLGIALDPNYSTNGYMYISYTANVTNKQNVTQQLARLSRFTVVNGALDTTTEKIYYQGNQQQISGHHPGNDLKVGPDGKLWWSVGDNVPAITNGEALNNIYGKMLRFNLDGSVPSDNPFVNLPNAVPYIYSYGLRNPFRFTFLPNGKAMVEDTGSSFWEMLKTMQPGANFGWPWVEGPCGSCGYANPAYSYGHIPVDAAASAITAYSGSTFPKAYDNVVFVGDYNRQDIEAVTFDPTYQTPISSSMFSTGAGTVADMVEGPDGNLYFVGVFEGKLKEISAPGPFKPTAAAAATPNAGGSPLNVQFSSAGSSDPYGKALTYSWSFGDGGTSTAANPAHTYTGNGTYTATLTVSNGTQTGTATTQVVVGQSPPSATITAPTTYNAGDTINFSATATDPHDGTLPPSAYTWKADFYSNGVAQPSILDEIFYPFYGPTPGIASGSFQIPTDPTQTPSSFYRITLTVTDSLGLKTVVTKDLHPNTTSWSASSNVTGTGYFVDGYWQTGNYSAQDVVGVKHVLMGMPYGQTVGANRYRFHGWSDGSALSDSFAAGTGSATHTALHDQVGATPAGWTSVDIGAPLMAGTTDYSASDQTFTLDGSGADVYGANDQFHYAYQTISGNATIVARVRFQSESSPWSKAGVMIKQAATAGSPFVDALVTPDVSPNTPNINCVGYTPNGCDAPLPPVNPTYGYGDRMQYTTGTNTTGGQGPPKTPGGIAPNKWVKLQRVGNAFTSFESTDGVNWTQIGATSVSMTDPVTIGLFVTSHNIGQLSSAAFDNVSITGQTTGGALPSPWTDTDVGSPSPAGSATYSNGTFTVQGSGADIYNTTDQFNYVYQPTTGNGNGTIIARVASQSSTGSSNEKSGVMFKQSTTSGTNYILISVSPAGNIKVEYNFNHSTGGATYTFPNVWMKLVRNGTTFTAYSSPDGNTWTQVLSTAAPNLTGNVTVGLFECSHKAGVLGTATFDNVSWTPGP